MSETQASPATEPDKVSPDPATTPDSGAPEGDAGAQAQQPDTTDWQKRYRDTEKSFHQKSEESKRLADENAAMRQFILQQQQRQAPADPFAEVDERFSESVTTFDKEGIRASSAHQRRLMIEEARKAGTEAATQAYRAQQGLDRAARYGVTDPAVLADVYRTLTPDELAVVKAHRDGRLGDILTQEEKDRERKSDEAKRLSAILAAPGGGRFVPGSLDDGGGGPVEVPRAEYFSVSESARKRRWPNARVV